MLINVFTLQFLLSDHKIFLNPESTRIIWRVHLNMISQDHILYPQNRFLIFGTIAWLQKREYRPLGHYQNYQPGTLSYPATSLYLNWPSGARGLNIQILALQKHRDDLKRICGCRNSSMNNFHWTSNISILTRKGKCSHNSSHFVYSSMCQIEH